MEKRELRIGMEKDPRVLIEFSQNEGGKNFPKKKREREKREREEEETEPKNGKEKR